MILWLPHNGESRSLMDERRREFFNEKIPLKGEKESKPTFEILSLNKGVVQDYAYDGGPGTRQVRCIEVKFKIHQGGELQIPYFYIYLYDSKKTFIKRLERMLIKEITGSHEIDPATFMFKGKKTYTAQFDYPNQVSFKYYLAVLGSDENMSVQVEPGNISWKELDFEEKDQLLHHSSSD
jgi:hypothetical protein